MVTAQQLLQRKGIAGREELRRRLATQITPEMIQQQQQEQIEVERGRIESQRKQELDIEVERIDKDIGIYQERVSNIRRQLLKPDLGGEKRNRLEGDLTEAGRNIAELSRAKNLVRQGYTPASVRRYTEAKILGWQQRQIAKQKAMKFEGEPLIAWKTPEGQVLYESMDPSLAKAKGYSALVVGYTGRGEMGFEELPQYRATLPTITPTTPEIFKFPETPFTKIIEAGPLMTETRRYQQFGYTQPQAIKLAQQSLAMGGVTFTPEKTREIIQPPRTFYEKLKRIITVPTQKLLGVTKPVREYELTPEQKRAIEPYGTRTGYYDVRGRFVPTPSPAEIPYTITPTTIQEVISAPSIIERDIRPFIEKGILKTGKIAGLEPTVIVPERKLTYEEYVEDIAKKERVRDIWKPTIQKTEEFRITEPITITEKPRERLTGLGITAKGLGFAPMIAGYIYAPVPMLAGEVGYGATQYSNLDEIYERALTDQYELHTKEPVEEGYRHLTEQEFKSDYGLEIKDEIKQGVLLETGVPLALLATIGAYKTYRVLTKPRGVSTKILGTSQKVSPTLEGKQKVQTDIMFETKTKTWFGTKTHIGVARSKTVTTDLGKAGETVTYGKFGQEGVVLPSGKIKVGKMKEFNVLTESAAKDAVITAQLEQAGIINTADIKGFQELFAGKVAVAPEPFLVRGKPILAKRLDIAPTKTDFIGTGTGLPILKTPETELTALFGKTIQIKKAKAVGVPSIYEGGIFSGLGVTDDLFFVGDSGIPLTQIQVQRALMQAQVGISAAVTPSITKAIPSVVPAVTTKPIIEIIKPDKTIIKPTPIITKQVPVTTTPIITPIKEKLKVEPILAPLIKPKIKPKVKEKVRVIQLMKPKEKLIERARVTPITALIPKVTTIQRVRASPKVKQISALKVRQVPVTTTPIITPRVPRLRIPVITWWLPIEERRRRLRRKRIPRKPLGLGYRVEVRRRGRFVPEIPFAVPKGEALWLGRRAVKRGAAATFRLRPTKEKPRRKGVPRITERALAIEFRKPKRGEDPLTFIQRRRFRIKTPGERREITMKGWATRRRIKEKWI